MSSCGMRSYVTPRVTATSDSLVISLARATVPAKLSFYVHFNWFRKEFQKDPLKIHYPVVMGYLFARIQTIFYLKMFYFQLGLNWLGKIFKKMSIKCYYFSIPYLLFEEGVALHLNKRKIPSARIICAKFGCNWPSDLKEF